MPVLDWKDYKSIGINAPYGGVNPPQAQDIKTDSRDCRPGSWFLPIKGEKHDGHDYIPQALKSGAKGFFYQTSCLDKIPSSIAHQGVPVECTVQALQDIASVWRDKLNIPVVGITGSCGKTTVKDLVTAVFAQSHPTASTMENQNNELGVPLTILRAKPNTGALIVEMGARHIGDIRKLSNIAKPTVNCLLNAAESHLGEFGSLQALRKTKLELIDAAQKGSTCIVSADDPILLEMAKRRQRPETQLVTFGASPEADIQIQNQTFSHNKQVIEYRIHRDFLVLETPYLHKSIAVNIAATLAIIKSACTHISSKQIQAGIWGYRGSKGRFHISLSNNILSGLTTIIDDSYNSSPKSAIAGIESVVEIFPNKTITFVLGDMLELGVQSKPFHQEVGRKLAKIRRHNDAILTVGQESQALLAKASSGVESAQFRHFGKVEDLIESLESLPKTDVIYVKGSRGMQLDKLVSHLT